MPSKDSRPASVRGSTTDAGCTEAGSGSTFTSATAGVISVVPWNSLTLPVTCTWSPMCTALDTAEPNTKTASEAWCVAGSTSPPVPAVWR